MPFHLIPPVGLTVDVSKGEQAAEAVFAANQTAPEIAMFGYDVAQKYAARRRCDPPNEDELRLANVFSLAWASAMEACTGAQDAEGWKCDVRVPDQVFVRMPGASVEAIRKGMAAACAIFREGGVTPQEAAISLHERSVFDLHGFEGPEPTAESARAAGLFDDAERAALQACGGSVAGGGYLSVEGFEHPDWRARMAASPVLNWKPEAEPAAAT